MSIVCIIQFGTEWIIVPANAKAGFGTDYVELGGRSSCLFGQDNDGDSNFRAQKYAARMIVYRELQIM